MIHGATAGVWLATPDAAALLDPATLEGSELASWMSLHTRRRMGDWAASRALLHALPDASGQAQSLSHSHGFAAVARTPAPAAIGVDVEWLSPRDFVGMARVAYSQAEADALASLGDPGLLCGAFYELWTFKEAFAKALSIPLFDALRQCCIPHAGRTDGSARVPTKQAWQATVYAPRPELRLAVVTVASTRDALPEAVDTQEWPPLHPVEWPAVRRLDGGESAADTAC
jgi:hypothetical protein